MLLGIKVDIDTERGTRIGLPNLEKLFLVHNIPATFLFTLGPDNTGRALKRIFRPGFLKKVSRTSVLKTYGLRTLLNGVLWPGPFIAKRHAALMQATCRHGFEVGIHSYDHTYWQDGVSTLPEDKIQAEFKRACDTFLDVFRFPAKTAGAAGWQANVKTLRAYDAQHLVYASDCRGTSPFFPHIEGQTFQALQLPTTLPTLDELLGRPDYPESTLVDYYMGLLKTDQPNIFTVHTEIEGMAQLAFMERFVIAAKKKGVVFKTLAEIAQPYLENKQTTPVCDFIQGSVEGRSGLLSMQGAALTFDSLSQINT
ncbi:MAG: 4-deoxy-4-formamido-L-arabinose-phosphoundecaprenol deformylase [Gammaproteobacteria bacterium]|nr:4-deoxy-4-formamido-L-arabinose-phosphoundecaprenol deformylase [Gammaproteobacteria bacterium]